MRSTMQDVPLTITTILRHACSVNADRTVTTAVGDGRYRTITYRELGEQVGRLANALRALGVTGDERVATFMWNNAEHLEAYLAVPSMGAVLHTLNIRLFPEQLAYIANHAEDQVVIVDDVAGRRCWRRCCRSWTPCSTVIVVGRGRSRTAGARPARPCCATTSCWPGSRPSSTGPSSTRRARPRCATPAAPPGTRKASSTATARATCTRMDACTANALGIGTATGAADRADVPRQCVGPAVRAR